MVFNPNSVTEHRSGKTITVLVQLQASALTPFEHISPVWHALTSNQGTHGMNMWNEAHAGICLMASTMKDWDKKHKQQIKHPDSQTQRKGG